MNPSGLLVEGAPLLVSLPGDRTSVDQVEAERERESEREVVVVVVVGMGVSISCPRRPPWHRVDDRLPAPVHPR
jgi:hypothetical protein